MNKLSTFAAVSFALVAFTTQALALNPQPEPPGKNIVMHMPAGATLRSIGSATSGAGAGKASDADDNYCGTRVPGHFGGNVTGGGRFSDADDNYCGTKVPGHLGGPIRYNSVTNTFRNSHEAVMLNPQPLPPVDGGSRVRY